MTFDQTKWRADFDHWLATNPDAQRAAEAPVHNWAASYVLDEKPRLLKCWYYAFRRWLRG